MLALRKVKPEAGAALVETELAAPGPGPGEVDVVVRAAGLCGSDLHAFAWDPGYAFMTDYLPVTIGHEFAGVVAAAGADVDAFAPGDRVVCWPTVVCGRCAGCRDGRPSACEARRIVGLHRDGGFAERVRVPAGTLRHVPPTLSFERAALCEPLSIAVNAVDLARLAPGDRVAVLGPGPIGAAAAFVARQRGARVLLIGLDDAARLALARTVADVATADLRETTLGAAVDAAFGGRCDRVIEATGAPVSVEEGLAALRPEGILVAAGIHAAACRIDLARFVREKKQLVGAHDTTEDAFAEALTMLTAHGDRLERLITHRLPLSRALEGFALARSRGAMKVMLHPEETEGTIQ
ncbi:sorbitol dehydrogenase [Acuticoccus sediminis]|uniref:Sorbitol dehydrogenase n=1 Tax=Acuticoccus sediminis TaxID=2184697 RepID=A0A8B2NSD0_9HYPH|nr:alcohol dehydrogenase catalytic domain-containing protein [Acuticoccus sediminis]RAI01821.1 sorbitol dehydrogenase [Acuticoccus sediminis]